ncbi:MAG: PSD1 and planctomycete cytochrome C domain-containing protein [Isosphaeraceae bacterium]
MTRHSSLAVGLAWLLISSAGLAADGSIETVADPGAFFEAKVRPILATRCFACHGPKKQKGGLRLDSRAAVLQGGDSGPAVDPGDADHGLLIEAIRYGEERQMPPKARLADVEIAALSTWIKAGAPWPGAEVAPRPKLDTPGPTITAEDRAFWAFQPINDPAPPEVQDAAWTQRGIDRFILAALESAKLRPVPLANKRTLIRRASFDLIGLPPTPVEISAFLGDESPDAFAKVVERLLASPHYGERWGRYWLDVARYGEDQAHTFQARKYPYGYKYRDWVARALNEDMPYDQFITEQIAGDLIDAPGRDQRLAALGLFALGPVYYGKAVADELDDRVDTLTRGFLGLTVACARCHDHKFDPISTKDYYALAGVFASTEYQEYPQASPDEIKAYDQGQAAIQSKSNDIDSFLKVETAKASAALANQTSLYVVTAWTLNNQRKSKPDLATAKVAKGEGLQDFVLDRWVNALFAGKNGEKPYLVRWHALIAKQDQKRDLSGDDAARAEIIKVADLLQDYLCTTIQLRDAIEAQSKAAAENSETKAPKPILSDRDSAALRDLFNDGGLLAIPKDRQLAMLSNEAKAALKAGKAELERLRKDAPPKYAIVHSLADGSKIANLKVSIRGNPATPGEDAPRAFLSILSDATPTPFNLGSGRLELARAIASPDNPLTARVLVNRVWEHHFGRALVGTPSNFGALGERPSHPDLLDYLASRFIKGGWSIKALHREIMLSRTYQLSASTDPTNIEVDPENLKLWRMNRRRLEVESWRDAMLAVSGNLDRTLGGPSQQLTSPKNQRRTFYAAISRHDLDGLLRLFDFPDPNITSDKRPVTSVPLQQLFVLNSEFMIQQARSLAARLTAGTDEPDSARIERAFPLVFGRPASPEEVRLGTSFLTSTQDPGETSSSPLSKWEQYAQVLLGSNEFAFVD